MKIFIATPCRDGQLTSGWFTSMLQTISVLGAQGHQTSIFLMDRDGIISRARNLCATNALENGFDKLLFVDADLVWDPQHVLMLLKSDKDIIGGTYPARKFPIRPLFNVIKEHLGDFHQDTKNMESFAEYKKKRADENGEVEVHHIPTGMLLVDTKVLKALTEVVERYHSFDAIAKKRRVIYNFFPIMLLPQEGTDIMRYETEDWGFCSVAKTVGFKSYLQTNCLVDHLGTHQYSVKDVGYDVQSNSIVADTK